MEDDNKDIHVRDTTQMARRAALRGIIRAVFAKSLARPRHADSNCAGRDNRRLRFAEALSPPRNSVFQTPPYNAERIADRYLHGVVLLARSRIVIHVDIGAAFNRKPDTKPVWIAREMLGPGRRDDDRRRRYSAWRRRDFPFRRE